MNLSGPASGQVPSNAMKTLCHVSPSDCQRSTAQSLNSQVLEAKVSQSKPASPYFTGGLGHEQLQPGHTLI